MRRDGLPGNNGGAFEAVLRYAVYEKILGILVARKHLVKWFLRKRFQNWRSQQISGTRHVANKRNFIRMQNFNSIG